MDPEDLEDESGGQETGEGQLLSGVIFLLWTKNAFKPGDFNNSFRSQFKMYTAENLCCDTYAAFRPNVIWARSGVWLHKSMVDMHIYSCYGEKE